MLVAIGEKGQLIGQDHPKSKLSNVDVDAIRELHDTGVMGYTVISRIFGVSRTCIKKIVVCETRWQTPVRFKKVA